MKTKQKEVNKFKKTIEATPHIKDGYRSGLRAFGSYSTKIELGQTSGCEGSVDIDTHTSVHFPVDNRWDYVFSYKGEVFFVEVHPANTAEVRVVLRKLEWIKTWLKEHAAALNALRPRQLPSFYWIQSGNFQIPSNTPQYRAASQAGLKPIPRLILK